MDSLTAVAGPANQGLDPLRLAQRTVERARELLGMDAAWLYTWDAEVGILSALAYADACPPKPVPVSRPGQGAIGLAFQRRQPVVVEDYATWEHGLSWAAGIRTGSAIAMPLLAGDAAAGVLFVKSGTPRRFASDEVRLLMELAAEAAPAVAAMQPYAEVTRRREEAEALAELVRLGAVEPDAERVISLVTAYAGLLLGADYALVGLTGSDGTVTAHGLWGNRTEAWRTTRMPAGKGITGRTLAAGRTLVFERLDDDSVYDPTEFRTHLGEGGRSVLATRLLSREQPFGALSVAWRIDVTLSPAQMRFAETLASYAATIIDTARTRAREGELVGELAARVQQLDGALARERVLSAVGREVAGTSDLGAMLARVLAYVANVVPYFTSGTAALIEDGALRIVAAHGNVDADSPSIRVPVGQGISGWVALHGRSYRCDDVDAEVTVRPLARRAGSNALIHSYLAVPITMSTRVLGVLQIGSTQTAAFTVEHQSLLEAVAAQIASALERARAEEALQHQALHDALTGLPNRVLLFDRLGQCLKVTRPAGAPLALLLMDLDRFKEVNDTLGHHYGDLLLQEVARRLRAAVRGSDTVARLGGDEFAVLLPGADLAGATLAARKLLTGLAVPFELEGRSLTVGASIGIAPGQAGGDDGETLLRHADVAMYVAKRSGSGYAAYDPAQDQYSPDRLALVSALQQAIAQGGLALHYQPKIDLQSGVIRGVEALARWPHPEHGLIAPDIFIPLAEATGLIGPLTVWVLDHALAQCRLWQRRGWQLGVAVNLSMVSLHDPDLPDTIKYLLEAHELEPSLLRLELTESTVMADTPHTRDVLTGLANLGVLISVDDFGTGFSSLAYLKRLPIDELKIDRSFVMHMAGELTDSIIVRSTINLGHSLGLRVVAEGVESQDAYDLLTQMGCDAAQGYHLSRPLPDAGLAEWLTASRWQVA